MVRRVSAELLGTAVLVYFGCGAATLMFGMHLAGAYAAGVVVTALTFGLVLMGLCYAIGSISGSHVNPAVTMGAWLAGRMTTLEALGYWGAQVVGAFLGALVLWGTLAGSPIYSRRLNGLGANGYAGNSAIHIDWAGAFLIEVVMTAVFVYVILTVTSKGASALVTGLVIGLTLGFVHLVGISVDGTSVNPARSLAPAVISGGAYFKQVWLFILAPLVGSVVAAAAHRAMNPPEPETEAAGDVTPAGVTADDVGAGTA